MMNKFLVSLILGALPLTMVAQDDDMYFVPSKKTVKSTTTMRSSARPAPTFHSGSNRSVDEYNRRGGSYYQVLPADTAGRSAQGSNDIIDFSGELGVYPDSAATEDFALTREMSRWDGYEPDPNAYAEGYRDGRRDSWSLYSWHSPWFYATYYPWYDSYWYWRDPWYYGGWYDPWYYGWYDPWYYGYYGYYSLGYRSYLYGYPYYYGGVGLANHYHNGNTGTINMRTGNMNGRIYSSANANGSRTNGGTTRLGAQRTTTLRNRTVSNHSTYNRNNTVNTTTPSRSSGVTYSTPSSSGSIGGGGFSSGGGRVSSGGGGGGGARSAGGHAGGRR